MLHGFMSSMSILFVCLGGWQTGISDEVKAMRIRHVIPLAFVSDGVITDPSQIRHGIIIGKRVADLSGYVTSATHLNLDFPEHLIDRCLVVEAGEVGSPVCMDGDTFRFAMVRTSDYMHLGAVDCDAERLKWAAVMHDRRWHATSSMLPIEEQES